MIKYYNHSCVNHPTYPGGSMPGKLNECYACLKFIKEVKDV